jgi:hypothetical protein
MDQHNNNQQPPQQEEQQGRQPYRSQPQGMTPYPPVFGEEPAAAPVRQSGLGIASFIIGLVSIVVMIIGFVAIVAALGDYIAPDGTIDPNDIDPMELGASMMVGILAIFGSLAVSFVGLILGIIGLVAKNRRKVFGVIGVVLNALLIVGFLGLFVFGLLMSAAA